jgi:polygalacturonase
MQKCSALAAIKVSLHDALSFHGIKRFGFLLVIGLAAYAVEGRCAMAETPEFSEPPRHSLTTPWGIVKEPSLPNTVCATLEATLTPVNDSIDGADASPAKSSPDAQRIQAAIDACPAGAAVRLVKGASGQSGFLSGPLNLRSGVTLWVDRGVTLFASRNPADYDNGPGKCGTAIQKDLRSCRPFILANDTSGSGIAGDGSIDGRGGSLLTSGPNANRRSWWDVAWQNKSEKLSQQNPKLIEIQNSFDFTLYRITVMNSANFHILPSNVEGLTAWGIKILTPSAVYSRPDYACPLGSTPDKVTPATCYTPETAKNTDGFDPAQSSKVLLAYSYISDGDDDVAIKSHGRIPSRDQAFLYNHFYYGHGMSIGSETDSGVNDILVSDLAFDGMDSPLGAGLRIKSDSASGGKVNGVTYDRVCMRNVRNPLIFDTFYRKPDAGTKYPSFTNITVRDFHYLGSVKYGGGQLAFAGFDARGVANPIAVRLDNVVFDGAQPTFAEGHNGAPKILPAATHFTLGLRAVSFAPALTASAANDVVVSGAPGGSTPLDCSGAFLPLKSVLRQAPF